MFENKVSTSEFYRSKWETSKVWKIIPLTSDHKDFFSRQYSEAVAGGCFIKWMSLIILKNVQKNTCVFFKKVASLTVLKKDSGIRTFPKILQHFEEYLFCKTHTHSCFLAFLKPQNKRYNDAKIRIYAVTQ